LPDIIIFIHPIFLSLSPAITYFPTTKSFKTSSTMVIPPYLTFTPSTGLVGIAPAVLVVQEWWGLNDEIKAIAQKVSDLTGAEVFVPDLYKVRE
jgi:dienelactone hydrolase